MGGSFLTLIVVWLVALTSPGPDVVQVIRCGMQSRKAGLACAVGICLPYSMYVILALAGLGAVVNNHPGIVHILQIFGGLYLLYIAYKVVRSLLARRASQMQIEAEPISPRKAFITGVFTNASNPKVLLFFVSVFVQFIGVASPYLIATIFISGALGWFIFIALSINLISTWLRSHERVIDVLSGTVFGAFGTVLVCEGVKNM